MIFLTLATLRTTSVADDIDGGTAVGVRADVDLGLDRVAEGQEFLGQAPLQYRPADPSGDDATELLVWHRGDEAIVIGSKDRRFEVELSKGEVALTNLPDTATNQVTIKLDASGVVSIGKSGGTLQKVLTEDAFNEWVGTIFDGHGHVFVATGAVSPTNGPSVSTAAGTVAVPTTSPFATPGTGTSLNGSPALKTDTGV